MKINDFRKFGSEASKYSEDKGKRVGEAGEVPVVKIRRETAKSSKRLSDIKGFSFYSLGPIYAATGIGFDIVGNFAGMTGYDGERIILTLEKPVIAGIGVWGVTLEGLPTHMMTDLKFFMKTQTAAIKDTQKYWRFENVDLSCPDPLGVDRNDVMSPQDVANITVFLPSGNTARYQLTDNTFPAQLVEVAPRSYIQVEGKAALAAEA